MGFRKDAFAKIWSIENKGNYSVANISVSKKNKETEKYEVEFQDGFVRLVGNAHEFAKSLTVPKNGVSVKITSCDVTNKYDAENDKVYYNCVIFGLEDASNGGASAQNATKTTSKKNSQKNAAADMAMLDDDDAQLPF